MRLRLNLSTTPQENNRPFIAGAAVIGGLGLIALLLLSHAAYDSWQSNRALRADISHWEQEVRVETQRQRQLQTYFQTPAAKQVIDRSSFLNALIDERSFPWSKIFTDLEGTIPPGVRVISLMPKLVNGQAEISMQVGVTSSENEIHFLQALEKSAEFSGITVNSVRPVTVQNTPDRILLNVSVRYTTA
jgi:Tfp pilus assembly protein PilN